MLCPARPRTKSFFAACRKFSPDFSEFIPELEKFGGGSPLVRKFPNGSSGEDGYRSQRPCFRPGPMFGRSLQQHISQILVEFKVPEFPRWNNSCLSGIIISNQVVSTGAPFVGPTLGSLCSLHLIGSFPRIIAFLV
ncbi:hypothetical protein R1flu_024156 [Riccia fluitans]|uniref:Uncharacterized protein n=1 Tax=Riccia fluitans TaxID=41844 RepID=A0ABD1XUI2_9MARC